ncbi:MAG: SurA N-terminal domain-containing protein [Campylobacterota bacterium]
MIGWMQSNRKYLVVTIWISVIAFVGAGFVGWGSYQYGGSGSTVAKVQDKEIEFDTYQLAYQNLFNQYNSFMGGNMDEATAKEMGLDQIALNNLINQAHFITLADDYGIVVSEKEIAQEIASIESFQTDGAYDHELYKKSIASMRLKPSQFEDIIADEIKLTKLLNLFAIDASTTENEALSAIVEDKIEYKVLSIDDIDVSVSQEQVKQYYEAHKDEFMYPRKYELSVVWTPSEDIAYSDEDIDTYYEDARFNYRDDEGKILPLEQVYDQMVVAYQMERAKTQAQKDYIDFRDAKKEFEPQTLRLSENEMFDTQTWQELQDAQEGDVIKPNAHKDRYATIKIDKVIQPSVKPFEEVRETVAQQAHYEQGIKQLQEYAQSIQDSFKGTKTDFISFENLEGLEGLNEYEAQEFAKELFLSGQSSGVFARGERAIVYRVLQQRLGESTQDTAGIKESIFEENLLEKLK